MFCKCSIFTCFPCFDICFAGFGSVLVNRFRPKIIKFGPQIIKFRTELEGGWGGAVKYPMRIWPAANTPGSSRVILTTVFLDFLKKQGYAMRQGLRHLMFRGA